jgi:hypothetical protein
MMPTHITDTLLESIEGAALIGFHLLTPFLRRYRTQWGALDRELVAKLPGDELVPTPKWQFTHAITIHAPGSEVWKWLVQIGADRGGLYSYEGLENLVGCNIHNADQIIPEYQNLRAGDEIKIHPKAPGMKIKTVEREAYILVHNDNRSEGNDSYINMTWLWYLDEVSPTRTRLISRSRNDYSPHRSNKLMMGPLLIEPISFVMERKMLIEIRKRAEQKETLKSVWVGSGG